MASDSDIDSKAERAEAAAAPNRRVSDDGAPILNGEIELLPQNRLPHLDTGPVQAFAARARGDKAGAPYFALVCDNALVPRTRQALAVGGIINPGFARLVASGVAFWPAANAQRYIFVYENTLGNPIMKPGQTGLGWKLDMVMSAVIRPMAGVLGDLRDADLFHGSIRPTNMFDGLQKMVERVILGDCLALPPSYNQPSVYEPTERAMADPIGRGRGTYADDLYAFGVSLAVIMRTRDPLEGMSDEDVIKTKLEIGSYAALTGKERFTGAVLEALRGLLYDDPAQRWTLDELNNWLDGQRLSPKQTARKMKAARPFHFMNDRYFRPSILAMDLNKSQGEALQLIESGALEQWIERSLEDKMANTRLGQAIESAQEAGRGPGYSDRLLSRVSIALDPQAPIRYRGKQMNPDGIAYALAEVITKKGDIQPFLDMITQQLVMYWLNGQHDLRVDVGALVSKFDSCRAFLRQPSLGYGVERCLYYLNPEAPCVSDTLAGYYVRNADDLMFALEAISKKPNRPHLFIDRHIAAFLSVKDRQVIDGFLVELNAPEFYKRILANIKVVALLQKQMRSEGFPGLASWAAEIAGPVYERVHDREMRDTMKKKVAKLAADGDLNRIAGILENPDATQRDFAAFKNAMREFTQLRSELAALDEKLQNPQNFGRDIGHEYAAIASAIIAGIIIVTVAILYFGHAGAVP